ncbi:hypothetical protein I551_8082 [Mycobacterium ulcerans str. Harvey]|uniref:Uncharacterized protein n=1 Tax=Mycobacterium ulcerans str. Harvey TaxID=1299332 RepID=A0ABP3A3X0_MYCUL|nr:hypothetical protein I551_8082 [Mycobacterium ulcerans str. Harvey]
MVGAGVKMPGGTALGGVSEWRSRITPATMTNATTDAIAPAATQARIRCRRLRREFVAMFSCCRVGTYQCGYRCWGRRCRARSPPEPPELTRTAY